jgi:hypothetical protein
MATAERDVRLQVMLQVQEMEAIEQWRFAKHMPSRAAAIRELIRRGLKAEGFAMAPSGKQSSDFGVGEGEEVQSANGIETRGVD